MCDSLWTLSKIHMEFDLQSVQKIPFGVFTGAFAPKTLNNFSNKKQPRQFTIQYVTCVVNNWNVKISG